MVTTLITVQETDKMEEIAQVFKEKDIHAAPVLNKLGKCVGIITSHDLVEYESVRRAMQKELNHGNGFDLAHYGSGVNFRWPGLCFGEVGFHMTKQIEPASVDDPLSRVARVMCSKHRHHVLILDEEGKPIGMLSSLDLLGFVIGEPVCRSSSCLDSSEKEEELDEGEQAVEFLMGHADFDS
jgi:CBS domain-containing protein